MKNKKTSWVIRGKVYHNLPYHDEDKLFKFLKMPIKKCPYCGKIDVILDHIEKCNGYDPSVEFWNNLK